MTYSAEDAEKAANKLVELTLKQQELQNEIKDLKANILEWAEVEGVNDTSWAVDNGYVELLTETKYKLSEIPVETKVDANACPIDIAEQAFTTKLVLTKEGKQMLREEYPTIMKLMIPNQKKTIKITT